MSYVRMGEDGSAVYVFACAGQLGEGYLTCCGCDTDPKTLSRKVMIRHLEEHVARGESVGGAIERLALEIIQHGDWVPGTEAKP